MKINVIHVRPGMVLDIDGKLCRVLKVDHVTQGRGLGMAHIQMKDIKTGTKLPVRHNSGVMLEKAHLDTHQMQFLYESDGMYTFMDTTNYEQTDLSADLLEDQAHWLTEGMEVDVEFYESQPVSVTLPMKVEAEIANTEAVIKGQTATSSYKPARLTNGATVQVPPYIASGDRITVNTTDGSFAGRV